MSPLHVWGPNKGRSKFAANVRDAFLRDQSRRGLARILGRIASGALDEVDGDNLQIPLAVLNKLNWTDSPFRLNLAYLRLVNADLSEDEATGLAQEIARLSDAYEYYVANCLAIARRRLSSKANERLALELCRALPGSSWEARSASYEALNDLLRQHHSLLGDPITREKLGLPKSVAG